MTEPVTQPAPTPGQSAAPPPDWNGPAAQPPPPHRPWRVPLIALSIGVAVLMIAVVAVSVVLAFFARHEQTVRQFDASVRQVTVVSDVGDVTVRAGVPGEAARVIVNSTVTFGESDWSAKQTGQTLDLNGSCDTAVSFGIDQCRVDFHVVVPPETMVQVRSSVGSVRVEGVRGDVSARTDTGDIQIAETTGDVDARTSTGEVSGWSVAGGSFTGRSNTGDVRLRFDASPSAVEARSDVGEVLVLVPEDGTLYRVDASSDVGETRIDVPSSPSSGRTLLARSDTGQVRVITSN